MTPHETAMHNPARTEARRIARKLGVTINYYRSHGYPMVDIYLPEGMVFDDNPGLDTLHHECEPDEDIWPGVLADMKVLIP